RVGLRAGDMRSQSRSGRPEGAAEELDGGDAAAGAGEAADARGVASPTATLAPSPGRGAAVADGVLAPEGARWALAGGVAVMSGDTAGAASSDAASSDAASSGVVASGAPPSGPVASAVVRSGGVDPSGVGASCSAGPTPRDDPALPASAVLPSRARPSERASTGASPGAPSHQPSAPSTSNPAPTAPNTPTPRRRLLPAGSPADPDGPRSSPADGAAADGSSSAERLSSRSAACSVPAGVLPGTSLAVNVSRVSPRGPAAGARDARSE